MKKNFTKRSLLLPLLQKLLFTGCFLVLAGVPSTFAQSTVSTIIDLGGFPGSLCDKATIGSSGDINGEFAGINGAGTLPPSPPIEFMDPVPTNSKITNIEVIIWNASCTSTATIDVTSGIAVEVQSQGLPFDCQNQGPITCPTSNSKGSMTVDLGCGNPGGYTFGGMNPFNIRGTTNTFIWATHIELIFTYEGCCPLLAADAPVAIVSAESTCSTFGGTPTGGLIAAPSTSCPAGSTLMYSTDGTTFTTTLPTYDPTTPVTVMTRCDCETTMSPTSSVTTVPGSCPTCPDLTAAAPIAIVSAESTCTTIGGTPTGGTIAAPSTSCPTGSTLMYSTDGTTFTTTLPTYNPTTAVTVMTRCDCQKEMSPTSSVTTMPGACPTVAPLAPDDLSVSDPCSCSNPNNIVSTTGLGLVELFHDVLEVNTTAGVAVTLSATDNNLLDVNGNSIPVGTAIPETAPGVYQLTFYTVPEVAANVTVSNGVSTENFTTASCSPCSSTIPTMSQWGLMIFGLLVLNLSLVFVGRLELA